MYKGFFKLPAIENEPVKSYAPGSPERAALKAELNRLNSMDADIPMIINGQEVRTGNMKAICPPHNHKHAIGHYHQGDASHVNMAIQAAMAAKPAWEKMSPESRAAIFLKAAELIAGPYRQYLNAATMLGQSKNAYQAEIDTCELVDFYRYNVKNMFQLYGMQPNTPSTTMWNRVEWRPLEGFVFALTPFNFSSIAGNLPGAPALLGNVCVWKPSKTAVYAAYVVMKALQDAGLPDGVINLVYCSGPVAGDTIFSHEDFAGFHFTGSTGVFKGAWKSMVQNLDKYKTYPRIVGETGGKDYIFADPTSDPKEVATAITRGAFEFQGQKCSAASRAFIPSNIWEQVKAYVAQDLEEIKTGDVMDFTNFVNAVIDEEAFDKLAGAIEDAKASKDADVVLGGKHDKSEGYFIYPTVIQAYDPNYITMREEFFGPAITVYVYEPDKVWETLDILDKGSEYGLTGAIFSKDRYAIEKYTERLMHTAGNFYINDKPTGAVVDQQPFGGGRASGTNDKAGSIFNLIRWVSPQCIKETFIPATHYTYPNFKED